MTVIKIKVSIFNIPQFIETEDKIAGPLTAKQLGWTVAAAATIFVVYLFLGKTAAWIMALPVLIIFGGFAFYKPNDQPLTYIVGSIITFFFHPKIYVWKRTPEELASKKKVKNKKMTDAPEKKVLTEAKIEEITALLHSEHKDINSTIHGNITFK